MKRIIAFLLLISTLLSVVLMASCSNNDSTTDGTTNNQCIVPDVYNISSSDGTTNNQCIVPDVYNISSSSAEQILINSGLIPTIVQQESDDIVAGNVIKCSPNIGATVDKNTRVTIFVSKGKSEQFAKSYECVDAKDYGFFNWEIQQMSIKDECLKITFEVEPLYDGGIYIKLDFLGSGVITLNDTNKEIPITYTYDKERITYKEKQNIYVSVPLNSFDGETIKKFKLIIDFNVNQPDWNFNPYDKTSTSSTFWWNIEW